MSNKWYRHVIETSEDPDKSQEGNGVLFDLNGAIVVDLANPASQQPPMHSTEQFFEWKKEVCVACLGMFGGCILDFAVVLPMLQGRHTILYTPTEVADKKLDEGYLIKRCVQPYDVTDQTRRYLVGHTEFTGRDVVNITQGEAGLIEISIDKLRDAVPTNTPAG